MTHTNVASRIHLSLACAAVPEGFSTLPYITWDSTQPRPGYEGLNEEFSDLKIAIASGDVDLVELSEATMPKNQKPLRQRGAGASGEIEKRGNHEGDEFNIPGMIKNENHSHSTSLPTISHIVAASNLEAQGEVA